MSGPTRHVRGELISLQLGYKDKQARKLIEQHIDYFLGPLKDHEKVHDNNANNSISHLRTSAQEKEWQKTAEQAFLWRNGFIYRCRLSHDSYAEEWDGETAELLSQVIDHPSGRFIVEFAFHRTAEFRDLRGIQDAFREAKFFVQNQRVPLFPRGQFLLGAIVAGVAPGVPGEAVSLQFQKGRPTEGVWIFDARSNVPGITKKDRPLTAQHFAEFEKCYGKDPNGLSRRKESERFRRYPASSIKDRDYKLDVTWLKDDSLEDSDNLPAPGVLAAEIVEDLQAALEQFRLIAEELGAGAEN